MSDGRPTVLVTGASGFVGRHVVPLLARNGWVVRCAVRTPPQDANDVTIDALGPATNWRDAVAGVDAVVHLAARVHYQKEEHAIELYHNVNVGGRCIWRGPRWTLACETLCSSARSWFTAAATTGVHRSVRTIH